ncbi:hypothetical protein FHR90_003243 [Endobacter medicaginis]|uniref:DUF4043 domain-containing protein n=1 Tax=Endobacter medicaginis TaxID=1181271 RepID=A0A839UYF7_9PROT|nr:DUF4043 domain-containing protein [Endobacter medicaginis]MBB3175388.1 hypothetical protein [Endobacter medicaginis]MCX5476730.1 DUF4043 domain-containing protein [Endobacter medicaginis]NVN29336.1 DUF4043 domain-containing protein [Endobacter medicaginis]
MSIANFPASLQPIIQQGFLARRFQTGLQSKLGFRTIADRMTFPGRIGQAITETRRGLKAPVKVAADPSQNAGLDNGMTPSSWAVEQYSLGLGLYRDTIDLNMVSEGVGIASQFLANAEAGGKQALATLDLNARDTLYFGSDTPGVLDVGGYLGGNTSVSSALSSASASLHVDDIRGFVNSVTPVGIVAAVSPLNPLVVYVNGTAYNCIGVVSDGSQNVSTAPSGMSGTLQFSANVATTDGVAGAPVIAFSAPAVIRPNGRRTTAGLTAGDTLSFKAVQGAVTKLRRNAVPTIDGLYNCHLSDEQLQGLFDDGQFQNMFRGAYQSREFRQGEVFELMGVRFIPTTEAPQQVLNGVEIQRAIVVGKGALIEGDYVDTGYSDIPDVNAGLKEMHDGICMITRPPLDRLGQIISQSWYWIGGFALPTDVTANPSIISTATNSALKRAVVIESL